MIRSRSASALLLSFFLMTMLILVAISVSVLVVRDMETVRTVVGGTQSYYAAEGASEQGLYELKVSLPGFEPSLDGLVLTSSATAELASNARGALIPCEGQAEEEWRALSQNESIQIPLFAQVDEDGTTEDVNDFYVEFYVGDEDGEVTFPPETDVLRWKILGFNSGNETEAISEYIRLYTYNGAGASETNPTFFGSDASALGVMPDGYLNGKYDQSGGVFQIYPISEFLAGHDTNYLVLTNIVRDSSENTLFFRFHSTGTVEGVCEYVELASTGSTSYGSTQQELTTYVREGESLPVFDFVLYQTEGEEEEESGGLSTLSSSLLGGSLEWSFSDLFGSP